MTLFPFNENLEIKRQQKNIKRCFEETSLEAEFDRDLFNPAELLGIKQRLLDQKSDAAVAIMHGDSVQRSGEDLGSGCDGTLP